MDFLYSFSSLHWFLAGLGVAVLLYLVFIYPWQKRHFENELKQGKKQFVGLASHYLLTPITIIQAAVTKLQEQDTVLTGEQRVKLYDAIDTGQRRLWIVAEQLVLVNEIEEHTLTMQLKVTNISDIVASAITTMDVMARGKKLSIGLDVGKLEISEMQLDQRRIKQALIAVIDNAIKFSVEETPIIVRIWQDGQTCTIEVEDKGIGMAPEVISHLSDKFYRGTGFYNFDFEGIGLGLHIANEIVTGHGGTLHFDSKVGKGTKAQIILPIR